MNITSTTRLSLTAITLLAAGCVAVGNETPDSTEAANESLALASEPNAAPVDEAPGEAAQLQCQKRGMTWLWKSRSVDVDTVGSDSITDAYDGDTDCNVALPILCVRKSGQPKPAYVSTSYYNGWLGGHMALTRQHLGYDMTSAQAADSICASELGTGWEMAEFHDGNGGWNFQGYGAATHPERFWVSINDQFANCWNSECN